MQGAWRPIPIWSQLNLRAPNDVKLVTSSANPQGDIFEVPLAAIAFPDRDGGPQTLTVRMQVTQSGNVPVLVQLYQARGFVVCLVADGLALVEFKKSRGINLA